jgi:ribosomal protein L11 methylase PrmA
MRALVVETGSYRDPSGSVYEADGDIYRSVSPLAIDDFETVWSSGYLQQLIAKDWLVGADRIEGSEVAAAVGAAALLRHPRLSFISYPYEWVFEALKDAALLHLDIQLDALDRGIALVDASAYNVQFVGCRPVFIDHLSFRPYQEGEFWVGHSQFLDQFLNPLLLRALLGVPHNTWYRGSLEGIPTVELNALLPMAAKFSFNVFSHVTLPASLQRRAQTASKESFERINKARLPRRSYRGLLMRLRSWIAGLRPRPTGRTTWQRYEDFRTYGTQELDAKRRFIVDFASSAKPRQIWDLGCNTGEFSELALESGAAEAVGFDFDQGSLDLAFARGKDKGLPFLPLFLDAVNPSPAQGWASVERKALATRGNPDALLALAFIHHLAIGRNVPLTNAVDWLTSLAPRGVIEFVPKGDSTVQTMLRLRKDVFPNYTEESFLDALARRAQIVKRETITESGRMLVWFER